MSFRGRMATTPDQTAIQHWHYPVNYPIRSYQFNIIKSCLYQNVLASLPTGLGKTFIAAVLIYNYYCWFPLGKLVFMAPTRPLVAQQISACYEITGINPEDTVELTGNVDPESRKSLWATKRVFFCTPQILQNDLLTGVCKPESIVALVIDEAHKATGNHAYCQVVRLLEESNVVYRILALTATPGSTGTAVQAVVNNLKISKIEIRTEESLDVQPFIQKRTTESITVNLSPELELIKTKLEKDIMMPFISRLCQLGAFFETEVSKITTFSLIKARESYRTRAGTNGQVEGDFAALMSLLHSYELLIYHGIRPFYNQITKLLSDPTYKGRLKSDLNRNAEFQKLLIDIQTKMTGPIFVSHPKLEKLESIMLEYFSNDENKGSKVLVFSQYRESVMDIVERLATHKPILKVASFVGQSSGKGTAGLKQKEQIQA